MYDTGFPDGSATGDGGRILILADTMVMTEGALIASQTFGAGLGGEIDVHAGSLLVGYESLIESDSGTPGLVTSVGLGLPNGTAQSLVLDPDNKTFLYSLDSTNKTEFDASFPTGSYTFRITTAAGTKTPALTVGPDAFPDAPQRFQARHTPHPHIHNYQVWLQAWDYR